MGRVKCSYVDCDSTSKEGSMFRFPTGDPNRLAVWLANCGNLTITHLKDEMLRNRYLCYKHFDAKYIIYGRRNRLYKEAVPTPYMEELSAVAPPSPLPSTSQASQESPVLKVLTPDKKYERLSFKGPEDSIDLPMDTCTKKRLLYSEQDEHVDQYVLMNTPKKRRQTEEHDTPKCKTLKKSLKIASAMLKQERNKYRRLKKKVTGKNIVNIDKHDFKSDASKLLTKMQLKTRKKNWTDSEKKFCMSLYYKSPAAYKYLLNTGVVLASPNTIQNWLQVTNCLPGINEDIFNNINLKFYDQSIKEKVCSICLDEMSIRVDLEYTKKYDLIEGFEDFGDGERTSKEAKFALVFVARGIYSNWKIPLAYFLSHKNVPADKLTMIIMRIINKLFQCGLLPKVLVCDQATTNVKAIKSLGATKDDPFFFIDGRTIFAIFDVPHLIKNLRNNLIDHDFCLNDTEISFSDIIKVYELDKHNKSKALRKLTPVHLKPNSFQKMKVKLATQVFSNSVASAIETAIASGELKSTTAKHTADFVKIINNLFDSLNSRNKFDNNPFKCAITKNKSSYVNKSLSKGLDTFKTLKKISFKNGNKIYTRPPCFDGMEQTINAILQFSTEEFSQGAEVKFMMTYRLNQDVIENLFGMFRMKSGCNRNPTSRNLRALFRSNLLNNLIKLDNTNCELDHDMFMGMPIQQQQNIQQSSTSPISLAGPSTMNHMDCSNNSNIQDSNATRLRENIVTEGISLETCSVVYFAGWLAKITVEKFDCVACKKYLIDNKIDLNDKKQLLLLNKTYSNLITPTLKSPSTNLYNLVQNSLNCFNDNITTIFKINLLSDLMRTMKMNECVPNNYHDYNHIDYLVTKLFEVKIHDYCKSRKKVFEGRSKLKILEHT